MASRPCVACRSPTVVGSVCEDCRETARESKKAVEKAGRREPIDRLERTPMQPRYVRRRRGGWSERRAERFFGGPVVPAVLLPWLPYANRIRPERRSEERPSDRSLAIWVPVGREMLRDLFPHGVRVAGPFVVIGNGEYEEGRGVVDWSAAETWAVPGIGIPVKVTTGTRGSGGYLPIELRVIQSEVVPYEETVAALDGLSDEFTAYPSVG